MKKILIFLLLLVSISGYSQLNLPFGVKVLNPVPLDSKYYNTSGAAYTNTAQVISQLTSGLRYEGLTVNVAGTEYWFYGGVADGDLVAKAGGSTDSTVFATKWYANNNFWKVGGATELTNHVSILGADTLNLNIGTGVSLLDSIKTESKYFKVNVTDANGINSFTKSGDYGGFDTEVHSSSIDIYSGIGINYNGTYYGSYENSSSGSSGYAFNRGNTGLDWQWYRTSPSYRAGSFTSNSTIGTSIINTTTRSTEIRMQDSLYFITYNTSFDPYRHIVMYEDILKFPLLAAPSTETHALVIGDDGVVTSQAISGYTDEQAQDAVGAMVDASLTYVDGTPLLQRAALTGAITASAGSNSTALGSFTSNALSSAISDPSRTVTGTGAIVQADNGRTLYFDSATPFNFTIDALTINSFSLFRNIGSATVTFVDGSGVASTGSTSIAAGETGVIEYITGTTPIIDVAGSGGGGGWATTGTTTLTGAATIAGSTTNTLTFQTPSLGTTYSSSYIFENPTASTSGNQQISPPKVERGYGWKTTATAASQPVEVSTYVLPVQGSTNPSLKYRWNYSINGAAPTTFMEYTNFGDALKLPSNITFPGNGFLLSGSTSPLYIGNGFSTIMSNSVIIRNQNNNANTSGTPNLLSIGGGRSFAPTSGTAAFSSSVIDMTINQTGTSSGNVYGYTVANTITSAKANTYGFYYSPSVTTIAGTEYAFNSTRGKVLINGTTITANTLLDVRGTGTTTNLIQRWADSGNTQRLAIQDNGVILVGTDAGTAGQVLTSQGSGSAPIWTAAGSGSIASGSSAYSSSTQGSVTLTASGSGTTALPITPSSYGNKTILVVETQFMAMKSDGMASAFATVTSMFRKDNSGTWTVDTAGTSTTSNVTTIVSIAGSIGGGSPALTYTTGAYSGTYTGGFTVKLSSYQY